MNCNACRGVVEPNSYLLCHQCRYKYYYKCLNMKTEQFKSLTAEYRIMWICPACNNAAPRRMKANCDAPIQSQIQNQEYSLDMSYDNIDDASINTPALNQTEISGHQTVTLESISQLLDTKLESSLNAFMSNLRMTLIEDIKKVVKSEVDPIVQELKQDFTLTTDLLSAEQNDLKAEIKEKSKIINRLETENQHLNECIRKLDSKISTMETISRASNVELHAVPESKNENLFDLFKQLCKLVNAPVDDTSIQACRRVAKHDTGSSRPRNVLITLKSSRERDSVISAVHRFNKCHNDQPLHSGHLGVPGAPHRIYVAENLSPEVKILFMETRKFARDKNYKYVWARFGKIYLRKDDNSAAILIKNKDTLSRLMKE